MILQNVSIRYSFMFGSIKNLITENLTLNYTISSIEKVIIIIEEKNPEKELILKIKKEGYSVFSPLHIKDTPIIEIENFIEQLSKGIKIKGKIYTFKEINVISSGEGGKVALTLDQGLGIKSNIILSPDLSSINEYLEYENKDPYMIFGSNEENEQIKKFAESKQLRYKIIEGKGKLTFSTIDNSLRSHIFDMIKNHDQYNTF